MRLLLVALVCFVAGFWLVAQLFDRKKPGEAPRPDAEPQARPPPSVAVADDGRVTLSNWYRILEVRENATREEIAAAYKRRIVQYHPDKVAQMGVEIREVAESKSKQINAAYEMGMGRYR
ncbi:MAG: J domain-containing protein [Steroidobacteraceae bacterium]